VEMKNGREKMYINKSKWSHKNVAYRKNKKKSKKNNRYQHNTDDGGQAMGEEIRHVHMSR